MSLNDNLGLPPDFVWGAATAAYQIEGAVKEDGRGESIWDRFSQTPGKVLNGETGDVACDHYHRWTEDIALMREIGLGAYRYSIAWPRIMPTGRGAVNQAGLDFYDRLNDGLLEAGIRPFVTLYHWDLPQALQDAGGWANRDTATAFADYADVVARRLGDRVEAWITHNEPWVAAFIGNLTGEHAPGNRDMPTALAVAHHLLLSHGVAVPAIRAAVPGARVGITLNLQPVHPATDSAADRDAAGRHDLFLNRLFLDPLFRGRYPEELEEIVGESRVRVREGDLAAIAAPFEFLGVNYYTRAVVRAGGGEPGGVAMVQPPGEYTTMGWEVYPDGLRELLERLHRDYPVPAYYVTENGAAFDDELRSDGTVDDPLRQAYLEAHFAAAARARAAGVPLLGYFVWSLMDNFEWAKGYSQRFGLLYVDFPTGRRHWKRSARWFQEICLRFHPQTPRR